VSNLKAMAYKQNPKWLTNSVAGRFATFLFFRSRVFPDMLIEDQIIKLINNPFEIF